MSPQQLANARARAARKIEQVFATTIRVGGHDIPAARWKAGSGADDELAGLLPTADLTLRVRRAVIPAGFVFEPKRTVLTEGGNNYRVEQIFGALGDPAIVLACKAV
jgi:hypothetical protein